MTESSDEAGFWAAFSAGPPDDTPYLAFADWLDDRGDPRAGWFRDPDLARWMRPGLPDPSAPLLEELDADDYDRWEPAAGLLAKVGGPAAKPLLERAATVPTGDETDDRGHRAARALAGMTADALRPFVAWLTSLIAYRGNDLAGAFRALGPDAAPAVAPLLDADEGGQIESYSLAMALSTVGPAAAPATGRLCELVVRDGSEDAAKALAAIGPHTLDALLDEFGRLDDGEFGSGHEGLAEYGPEAAPRFASAARVRTGNARHAAALALASLAPDDGLPLLLDGLRTAGGGVLTQYVRAVRGAGARAAAATPILLDILRRPDLDAWFAEQVADAIAAVSGGADLDALAAGLTDPDPTVRARTVTALGAVAANNPAAEAYLYDALRDAAEPVRVLAAERLGVVLRNRNRFAFRGAEGAAAVPPLRAALGDPAARVRELAANALGALRSSAAPAVPELLVAMRDPEVDVRRAATRTVDGMQHEEPEMLGALLAALDDPDEEVRHAAAHGLQEWGNLFPEHTAAVLARTTDPDEVVRRGAVRLIGKATDPTPDLAPFLLETLRTSDDPELRASAAAGLGRVPDPSAEALDALFAFLDEGGEGAAEAVFRHAPATLPGLTERLLSRPDLRLAILRETQNVRRWDDADKPAAAALVPGLIASFADREADVRQAAAETVTAIGPPAAPALPTLRPLLTDYETWVRVNALRAVATVHPDPDAVLPDVVEALTDPEEYVREAAVRLLGELPADPAARFPHLHAALRSETADVRKQAAEGLSKLGPVVAPAVPDLLAVLADESEWTRCHAATALGQLDPPAPAEVVAALRGLLADASEWPRREAAEALGKLKVADAAPELTRLLAEDPDAAVRRVAAVALGELGAAGGGRAAVADLCRRLSDPNGETRATAAQTLGALGPVAADAVPDLIRALADPAWGDIREETRRRFIFGGMTLLPADQIERLGSMDQRLYVAAALAQIGPPELVIPPLRAAVDDPDSWVRSAALTALQDLRPATDPVFEELRTHPNETVREWAEGTLNPPSS